MATETAEAVEAKAALRLVSVVRVKNQHQQGMRPNIFLMYGPYCQVKKNCINTSHVRHKMVLWIFGNICYLLKANVSGFCICSCKKCSQPIRRSVWRVIRRWWSRMRSSRSSCPTSTPKMLKYPPSSSLLPKGIINLRCTTLAESIPSLHLFTVLKEHFKAYSH